uniref:Reverse transcriptase domain-containing protein n=1 Tax=Schistocephalus solidus TaxID=70667 RepID=A0A183T2Z8_SCHSO
LPPSLPETIRAVQQIASGKAPGSDVIPPEVYKHGISSGKAPASDAIPPEVYKHSGPRLMAELITLFQEMWRQGQVPQDFKDATIVHLYKRKGNRQLCDNHRGISLLTIAGKIFARILNRLNGHLEQGLLPESQCGFHRHRGTTDIIFTARQLQKKCHEMRTHLDTTFVDLTKASNTINRDGLWKVMQKFGCPERFTHMVRQLHDGMMVRVTDNGTVSEAVAVTNGVEQGCVLAPTLFSLMFSAMQMDAYCSAPGGVNR